MKEEEKRKSINFLMEFCERHNSDKDVLEAVSMYEFVTEGAVDALGNMGEHEWAVRIDKKAIKASLSCRRMWGIHYKLYDIWWNENEIMKKEGKEIGVDKTRETLKDCVILSHYAKAFYHENVYRNKLEKLN